MSARVVFVSGIDTGIGKTYATGYLARREMEKGLKVATLKLVQTGNEGFSEDIKTHREIMGASLPEDADFTTAPQIFRFPSSPEPSRRRSSPRRQGWPSLRCRSRCPPLPCRRWPSRFRP